VKVPAYDFFSASFIGGVFLFDPECCLLFSLRCEMGSVGSDKGFENVYLPVGLFSSLYIGEFSRRSWVASFLICPYEILRQRTVRAASRLLAPS
jgi:hypothetical protein